MKKTNKRLIVGLMSGTSVDGIDAALVEVTRRANGQYGAAVIAHSEHLWPRRLRQRLLAAMAPATASTAEICELNFLVAREFALAVEDLLTETNLDRNRIAAIASHGQTVCHLPIKAPAKISPRVEAEKHGSTLQLGDVSVLATLTRIATVGNFRAADMAAGGQGAPLVPWADDALLSHDIKPRCVQNIGGIANVTYLPARSEKRPRGRTFSAPSNATTKALSPRPAVIAFDTGPGNMVIDAVISLATHGKITFDQDGRLTKRGKLNEELFTRLQSHDYFQRPPPKSTGREEFGVEFTQKILGQTKRQKLKLEDIVHTVTRLTAWSIAAAYRRFLPRMPAEIILCGGGADNPALVEMLKQEFTASPPGMAQAASPQIRRIEEFGIPNKAKEAASFALLAAATLDGIPGNLPAVTGARHPVILGVIARP